MPALIDTHLHLIYRKSLGYGWTSEIPALATGDFTLDDARALMGDRVAGAVFMEAAVDDAGYKDEARLIGGLIGQSGGVLLGQIASCRPEEPAGLDDWIDEGQGLGVVGYRRVLHVVPDALSQSDIFRRNISMIGARGLTFDMCFTARQLGLAQALAQACPDTKLVLDHCGVPDIAGGGFDAWRAGIDAIAKLPHVTCKLSGLMAYCAPGTAGFATIRPYVDHVFTRFGPDRVVWGSDWPVVNLGGGLVDWLDVTAQILDMLSAEERIAVAHGNARQVYGLPAAP
ncbi:amidohydrolase family protein [Roseinatronobacter alkalisoli]|uniref:Amidohydrolase family protein n=1 Tax=Roseinatronobacter alkalisoli TaxID=3028235 RepID=A0ABT5T775_9RHOB|nr:amidohydrolase family protein [Roseinatronobacter sp. HJB301]MDD7970899.1 amidohydrolase family protein [Roseinatronobacter sp. HJB301]